MKSIRRCRRDAWTPLLEVEQAAKPGMATYATYRLDCRPARDELIVESLVIPFVGSCSTYSATAATLFNSLRACGPRHRELHFR